jgi:type IX secretion system PorP/SprF family membrane protein
MGFGAKIINDHLGATNQFNASLIYAYHLGLGKGKLSVGIEGGLFSQTIDFASLYRVDKIDNAIPNEKATAIKPDASFGIQFQARDYFVGFSIVHLFASNLNFTDTDRSIIAELSKHYFLSGGLVYDLKNDLSIQPCMLLKMVSGAPAQMDLYTNVIFKEKYTLGVGYRTSDALTFVAKYHITDAIRVSYSYDARISKVATYSSSAHEFMVRYGIKLLPPQQIKEINPRYYF